MMQSGAILAADTVAWLIKRRRESRRPSFRRSKSDVGTVAGRNVHLDHSLANADDEVVLRILTGVPGDTVRLALRANGLTQLPVRFVVLSKLQTLLISGNALTELPDALCDLPCLKLLGVNHNQLTGLPRRLGQLGSSLTQLIADYNHIAHLPDSIGQLRRLHRLSLGGNELTCLPTSLSQLTRLDHIVLNRNPLGCFPHPLLACSSLTRVSLDAADLQALPESIGLALPALEWLSACDNRLSVLPASIARLTRLRDLHLGGNDLCSITDTLTQGLAKLQTLQLGRNRLRTLPERLPPQLLQLDLSRNQLVCLPDSLASLRHLEDLDVSHNCLTDLPARVPPVLLMFDVRHNRLTSLPSAVAYDVPELYLDHNPWPMTRDGVDGYLRLGASDRFVAPHSGVQSLGVLAANAVLAGVPSRVRRRWHHAAKRAQDRVPSDVLAALCHGVRDCSCGCNVPFVGLGRVVVTMMPAPMYVDASEIPVTRCIRSACAAALLESVA